VKNLLEEDAPTAAFRQPYFNNTDDILAPGNPERSTSYKIFPWALIVSHPDLRTFGLTARVKFGGAQD
jgi:hypothetical protein